ncbi:Imm52 family immunity protein [Pseudomonas chlororaphis]|uniref:Immunity protein 52 domain-containing protein n=1 Tax=Pseudomonas chlororaphis TaxID=587753 RepID=A0AAX3FZY3_9PSED|nr:Imm52 family immunity protein [Pseudomonas chlororaphis]AZC35436.1 hypothetical protein C4K37_1030 [Pseudomonas chlororaphis subsp. piscium]AZC41977.1 hypothetical protein C4K36_1033 [Pseudomonas chlororaphis subsp. piscium]WDG73929.1 Imm52 family immunity protein [Pseudomonas chlororaphis]WDH28434.1 Imm52 family immunity protein [Pseudomonas chlororaphis]WDH72450.1 Imm52 family immunity protein [Pseudomonas chlororaphis]
MFRKFSFVLRFDKQKISAVSHEAQLERAERFLKGLGEIHPLLRDWYLQGGSREESLRKRINDDFESLREEARSNHNDDFPTKLQFSVWNGLDDPLKGGLAFHYNAHDLDSVASMRFEDGGALVAAIPDVKPVVIGIIQLAVELWPELDWCVLAPKDHYLRTKVFKDRQTAGWVGFCPKVLRTGDFPSADQLIDIPKRGTLIVSCPQVMDEGKRADVQRVAEIDIKLVELGYLPLFMN